MGMHDREWNGYDNNYSVHCPECGKDYPFHSAGCNALRYHMVYEHGYDYQDAYDAVSASIAESLSEAKR